MAGKTRKPRTAGNKRSSKPDAAQMEALKAIANFGPAIDPQMMQQIEDAAGSGRMRQARRISLAVLSKSADELSAISRDSPKIYAQMFDKAAMFAEHAKWLSDESAKALLRLDIADMRGLPR